MSRLLRADFSRLIKSKIFWFGVIFMAGLAGFAVYTRWSDKQAIPEYYHASDDILFAGAMYMGVTIAVFMGIFVSAEYSSGTIRNKHIIGHSRIAMYLSNLIVCSVATVIMHLAFIAVIIGASELGIIVKLEMPYGKIALHTLLSSFSVLAITAILLTVYMLITGRIAGFLATILSLVMIMAANTIDYRLSAKEYIEPYQFTVTNVDGTEQEIQRPLMKNPKFLTGTKRKVFQFFHDTLPVDQIIQMNHYGNCSLNFIPRSLCVIAVVTTAGIFIFRKKDIK